MCTAPLAVRVAVSGVRPAQLRVRVRGTARGAGALLRLPAETDSTRHSLTSIRGTVSSAAAVCGADSGGSSELRRAAVAAGEPGPCETLSQPTGVGVSRAGELTESAADTLGSVRLPSNPARTAESAAGDTGRVAGTSADETGGEATGSSRAAGCGAAAAGRAVSSGAAVTGRAAGCGAAAAGRAAGCVAERTGAGQGSTGDGAGKLGSYGVRTR